MAQQLEADGTLSRAKEAIFQANVKQLYDIVGDTDNEQLIANATVTWACSWSGKVERILNDNEEIENSYYRSKANLLLFFVHCHANVDATARNETMKL
jgi:hypothetical protein